MQFDLFVNPLPDLRRILPYVVVLQSDLAETGNDRIVAFVARTAELKAIPTKLMPVVDFAEETWAIMLPTLTNIPRTLLRRPAGNISEARDRITSGIDLLFLGV